MSELVYHATTPSRTAACLHEGLIPYKTTECKPTTLARDRDYDDQRPDTIRQIDLRRLNCVYAHLDLANARERRNGGWLNRIQSEIAVISIAVNPDEVYVADGLLNAPPYTPAEYWASVTTLRHYQEQDNPIYRAPSCYAPSRHDRPDLWRRYRYMWPEVLIPNGVSASDLELMPKVNID